MKCYAIVETLNGNFILKPIEKVRWQDKIEIEICAADDADARVQFNTHKKELKALFN